MFVMKPLFMMYGVYYYYISVYHKLSNEHSVNSTKWEVHHIHQDRMNTILS